MLVLITFANNIDRDQTLQNIGSHLLSTLYNVQCQMLLKIGYNSRDDLYSDDMKIISILQIAPELSEDTVQRLMDVFVAYVRWLSCVKYKSASH